MLLGFIFAGVFAPVAYSFWQLDQICSDEELRYDCGNNSLPQNKLLCCDHPCNTTRDINFCAVQTKGSGVVIAMISAMSTLAFIGLLIIVSAITLVVYKNKQGARTSVEAGTLAKEVRGP